MNRLPYILPLLIFALLIAFLLAQLGLMNKGNTPNILPSAMIGKPIPDFVLKNLKDNNPAVSPASFKDKVTLVNFFASWCEACKAEHPFLLELKGKNIYLVGIAYKDKPEKSAQYLSENGDPYDVAAVDAEGKMAIDFGLYGVPETYLIDKNGIIRFREAGPLTPEKIDNVLLPLIAELNK